MERSFPKTCGPGRGGEPTRDVRSQAHVRQHLVLGEVLPGTQEAVAHEDEQLVFQHLLGDAPVGAESAPLRFLLLSVWPEETFMMHFVVLAEAIFTQDFLPLRPRGSSLLIEF